MMEFYFTKIKTQNNAAVNELLTGLCYLRIREIPSSNLGQEPVYLDWHLSRISQSQIYSGHNHFLLHPFQFIIHYNCIIQFYKRYAVERS
jgi:hypothetical protein